jgi:hypothetical protein
LNLKVRDLTEENERPSLSVSQKVSLKRV